jgi:hypothetical protein
MLIVVVLWFIIFPIKIGYIILGKPKGFPIPLPFHAMLVDYGIYDKHIKTIKIAIRGTEWV